MNYQQAIQKQFQTLISYGGASINSANTNCQSGFYGLGQFVNGAFDNIEDHADGMARTPYCVGAAIYGEKFHAIAKGTRKRDLQRLAHKLFNSLTTEHGRNFAQEVVVSALDTITGVQVIPRSVTGPPGYFGIDCVLVSDSRGRNIKQDFEP